MKNLLGYYRERGISPVLYKMKTWKDHFERRDAVYRSIGLPPFAFRGSSILEIAPGSGQNSVYLASQEPASLDLVEPNEVALADIKRVYGDLDFPYVEPTVHPVTVEQFKTDKQFDVVICENWLGLSAEECDIRTQISKFVAPGGLLITTAVPYTGFLPNVIRTVLAACITDQDMPFDEQVAFLVGAFGPHLDTMPEMTRTHEDWVKDCLLNPFYLNVALPLTMIAEDVGDEFEFCGTVPRFSQDWRWFKSLTGENRSFNAHIFDEMSANRHNFISHRHLFDARSQEKNKVLEDGAINIHNLAMTVGESVRGNKAVPTSTLEDIGRSIAEMVENINEFSPQIAAGFKEVRDLLLQDKIAAQDIASMSAFNSLFGREMMYVSLIRREVWA